MMAKLPRAGRPSTAKERALEAVREVDAELLPPTAALSDEAHLNQLEQIIDANIKAFYEVGRALKEIHDQKLYKILGYSRFEDYCIERWDMHQGHARRLEAAATVLDNLKTEPLDPPYLPSSERQIRPMTVLTPAQQKQVWGRVLEDAPIILEKPKISTRLVQEKVSEVLGFTESKTKTADDGNKKCIVYFSEDTDDSLNESLYKLRKLMKTGEKKQKLSRDVLVEAAIQVALTELADNQDQSQFLAQVMALLDAEKPPS
jgi:hypothetical protein